MARKPDLPCSGCGKLLYRGSNSLPEGKAMCQPCRRLRNGGDGSTRHEHICEECGRAFASARERRRFCSTRCSGDYQSRTRQVRSLDDCRVKRIHREHVAPGLSVKQRARLRDKWRRQGKRCVYCPRPADTVDHVLPLVRGGTNYEGNLAPCCKSCNSSKSGKTVIEWRTGKTLPRMVTSPGWTPKQREPKPKPTKAKRIRACGVCFKSTNRPKYCSTSCCTEAARRITRDRYRRTHGLPVNFTEPTSKWAA